MAYQVKRSVKTIEELELADETGEVVEKIEVRLDVDGLAEKASKEYVNLINIQKRVAGMKTEDVSPELLEEVGSAVLTLCRTVFGEADTNRIVAFYDNNWIEMCTNVIPFVIDVCIPQIRKIGQNKRKNAAKGYNRKMRRRYI